MEDEIVTFETAVLAYNKGFRDKISCIGGKNYYNYKGELNGDSFEYLKDYLEAKKEDRDPDDFYLNISAPTQSLLQRWLREKYNIQMFVSPLGNNPVKYVVIIPYCYSKKEIPYLGLFHTYEKALEKGLELALQMI